MSAGNEDSVVIIHAEADLDAAWTLKRAAIAAGCPGDHIALAATSDEQIARETLSGARQVVLLLTAEALRCRFLRRLLDQSAKEKGVRIGLVLGTHADYEPVLGPRETLHDPRLALDCLPLDRQAPVFAQAGERLRRLQLDPEQPKLTAPAPREEGFGVSIAFLGLAIESRQKKAALWRQVAGHLVWASLALISLGVGLWILQTGVSLPLMLGLGAVFFLTVALVLHCRARLLADVARTLNYMRSGLLDPRLPTRQSTPLLQRAASLPGVKQF